MRKTMVLLEEDPWARKRTILALAILDIILGLILICYAGVRLLHYNSIEQTIMSVVYSDESVLLSMVYWLTVFTLLSMQIVIAFFLLTATNDMTEAVEAMISKCIFWRIESQVFLGMLAIDLTFLLYDHFIAGRKFERLRASLDLYEMVFRVYGIYFIGKFINDIQGLFKQPMTQWKNGTPVPTTPPIIARRSKSIPVDNNNYDVDNYV